MKRKIISMVFVLFSATVIISASQETTADKDGLASLYHDIMYREALTGSLFGLREVAAERGVDVSLSITQIYQQNIHGGLSTKDRSGRYSGSYDLEVALDMEKLLNLEGAGFYLHTEGGWPEAEGINEESAGTFFGVNDDAGGCRAIDITELWYEQSLFEGCLTVRLGKMDLTGGFECRGCPVSFDCCTFANDETSRFLNSALVNNPTIPFPDCALGMVIHYNPLEWWYASIGAADAQADARETGFNTAFHGEDYFFYIVETGITPRVDSANGALQGAYRVGAWYDPQEKEKFSGGSVKRDDAGIYLSFDQMIYRENTDPEDGRGLGIFGRYGWSGSEVGPDEEVTNFWSIGLQYQGLVSGRDEDIIGCAIAQGIYSDQAEMAEDSETVMELYYNARMAGWLNLTPSLQYIDNPGGDGFVSNAVVIGARLQMAF